MNRHFSRLSSLGFFFAMLSFLSADSRGAVSLLNPSFEDSPTWQSSGWLQTVYTLSGAYDPQIIQNSHSSFGDTPFGQRYALMEQPDIGNAVMQYVTGFEAGQSYKLSFWAAASTSDSVVQIGGLIGVQDPAGSGADLLHNLQVPASQEREFADWYEFSITFTALSETMTLWVGQAGQGFGPVYFPPIAVDQISLTAVPELGTIGITLTSLLIATRRRRH